MHDFLLNPFVHGAMNGLGTAVGLDLIILKGAHDWGEFLGLYNWRVASFRYVQGIIIGGIVESGLSAFFGL